MPATALQLGHRSLSVTATLAYEDKSTVFFIFPSCILFGEPIILFIVRFLFQMSSVHRRNQTAFLGSECLLGVRVLSLSTTSAVSIIEEASREWGKLSLGGWFPPGIVLCHPWWCPALQVPLPQHPPLDHLLVARCIILACFPNGPWVVVGVPWVREWEHDSV